MKLSQGVRSVASQMTVAAGVLVLASVPAASPAGAVPPTTSTSSLDTTVRAPGTSALCGFDVYRRTAGMLTVRLFRNRAGLVVAEEDLDNNLVVTWSAPSRGTSFSYKVIGPLLWDYPGGATFGSSATLAVPGRGTKVPGDHAAAGLAVLVGTVDGFSPEGIPLVSLDDVIKDVGSPVTSASARCAALA